MSDHGGVVREALGDPNLCTPDEFAQQTADALAALAAMVEREKTLVAERDAATLLATDRVSAIATEEVLSALVRRAEIAESERDEARRAVQQEAEQTCIEIELRKAAEAEIQKMLYDKDEDVQKIVDRAEAAEAERDETIREHSHYMRKAGKAVARAEAAEADAARLREALAETENALDQTAILITRRPVRDADPQAKVLLPIVHYALIVARAALSGGSSE